MPQDQDPIALRIRGLSKTYKNGVEALKGIDLEVERGEFFGLLGPNGAGKSTTIGIVTSLVNRSGGSIEVFGVDAEEDPESAKRLIGIVPQELNLNQFEKPLHIVAQQAGEELKSLVTSLRELLDSAEPSSRLGTLLCNSRAYQGDEATQRQGEGEEDGDEARRGARARPRSRAGSAPPPRAPRTRSRRRSA